jgi:hypothetical protein
VESPREFCDRHGETPAISFREKNDEYGAAWFLHVGCDCEGCYIMAEIGDGENEPGYAVAEALAHIGRDALDLIDTISEKERLMVEMDKHLKDFDLRLKGAMAVIGAFKPLMDLGDEVRVLCYKAEKERDELKKELAEAKSEIARTKSTCHKTFFHADAQEDQTCLRERGHDGKCGPYPGKFYPPKDMDAVACRKCEHEQSLHGLGGCPFCPCMLDEKGEDLS